MKALKTSLIAFLSIIILVSSKTKKKDKFFLLETKSDEGGKIATFSILKSQYMKVTYADVF